MQESEEEATRREDMLRMYHTMKEALNIVSEVSSNTISTPLPPPVKDEWALDSSSAPTSNGYVLIKVTMSSKQVESFFFSFSVCL